MAASSSGSGWSSGSGSAEEMVAEARKAFFVMFGVMAAVWLVQVANWADGYGFSRDYGVVSGQLGRLPDIFTAPVLHWSWEHIESNSGPLFVFGFLAAYRGVRKFLGLTLLIAVTSGLAVWLFESRNTDTVGASGLIFGYLGYVIVRGLFDRHLIDTLIGVVMAASYAYDFSLTVPGVPGISWLGHLGGLAGGLLGAWLLRERGGPRERRPGTPAVPGDAPLPASGPAAGSAGGGGPRADLHKELGDLGLL